MARIPINDDEVLELLKANDENAFDNRTQIINPHSKLVFAELCAQIDFAVELVPKKSRIVYELGLDKQLSHKEISEKLRISTKIVAAMSKKH